MPPPIPQAIFATKEAPRSEFFLPYGRMFRCELVNTVDSTNTYLRNLALDGGADGLIVCADCQTGGRGRRGRAFLSPGGMGVYMSALIRPRSLPEDTAALTAWTAEAMCRAAQEENIPYQVQVTPGSTPTDANAMQINQAGMAVGLLGVALRYMHTPCEVLSLRDVEDCARLMAAYCRRLTPETDFTPR